MVQEELSELIEFINELEEEGNMPKNVKAKFQVIKNELKSANDETLSLTVNKLLSDLDDISSDANLDQFTRQQIWSISSMLESI
jgi:uncharacterized protein (UPF0147 family)